MVAGADGEVETYTLVAVGIATVVSAGEEFVLQAREAAGHYPDIPFVKPSFPLRVVYEVRRV
jgi:hypothetical protein